MSTLKLFFHFFPQFQVYLPSSTVVRLGPYLSYIKVAASVADVGKTEGLCGSFDGIADNEFTGACRHKQSDCAEDFTRSWM